jgi:hypothetical protein
MRHAELVGEFFERDRLVSQTAHFEEAPLAVAEHPECLAKRLAAIVRLLALGKSALLAGAVIDHAPR